MAMTRRRVLTTLASAATAGAGFGEWRLLDRAAIRRRSASEWRRSLEAIGATYVRQRRQQGRAQGPGKTGTLTEALHHLGVTQPAAAALLASGVGPRFAAGVRDDFDCGRTTEVDGWVLSTTEVAVALVAWSEGGGHADAES